MFYYFRLALFRLALAVNMESVLTANGGRRLSFLVCLNILWPFSLNETSDRVK